MSLSPARKPIWVVARFTIGNPASTEGYAGLETYEKKGSKKGQVGMPTKTKDEIIAMRRAHADWGKHRITDEMAKANNWVAVVSPNTVRRILEEVGLWSSEITKQKKEP